MSLVVFVGPTVPRSLVEQELPGAKVEGPAGRGDIYRAVCEGALGIILIDGYFDQRLAVWHKEILFALSRGIRVYGAASMGALRAAELHRFGMVGLGRIFDWYVSGFIEADDEVAIVHEGAETGFRAVSEALVNLRATLQSAEKAGVIAPETHARLVEITRFLFYPSRTMRAVLARAAEQGVSSGELGQLREWLAASPSNFVDQKRIDALALLERVRGDLRTSLVRETPPFDFEYTEVWHELTRTARQIGGHDADARTLQIAKEHDDLARAAWTERIMRVLDACEPALSSDLRRDAERRAALLQCAALRNIEATPAEVQSASDEFRHERGLLSPASTRTWLDQRGLDISQHSAWMIEEVLLSRVSEEIKRDVWRQLRRVLHGSHAPQVIAAILADATGEPELANSGNVECHGA